METVHIMYEGKSEDIELEVLIPMEDRQNLGIDENSELKAANLTGSQIKRALSNHYDQSVEEFNELSVEFHKNGNITVRPQATFGK